jgi:hypothetical protein
MWQVLCFARELSIPCQSTCTYFLLLAEPKLPCTYPKWLLQVTFHLSSLFVRLHTCLLAGRLRLRLCMYILYVKVDCGASSVPSSAGGSSPGKVLYWSIQMAVVQCEIRKVGDLEK